MFKLHTEDWLDLGEFLDSLSYLCGPPKDENREKCPPQYVDRQTKTTHTEWAIPSQTSTPNTFVAYDLLFKRHRR